MENLDRNHFKTILADPPWRFNHRYGKVSPEHKTYRRYKTMRLCEIAALPVKEIAHENSHLYLWVPNALISQGLYVMQQWGFTYKANITWLKVSSSGEPDRRGVGFYFRNATELILFGVKGKLRTLQPGRTQVNVIQSQKREHSRKPEELYPIIEACSPPPYLELFARSTRENWSVWGNETNKFKTNP